MGECQDCGGKFFLRGENGDMVSGETCPGCGSTRYRRQPEPLQSEMHMRNMPAPGEEDMGGNPLQEGILSDGGWKQRQHRDESFASVQSDNRDQISLEPYEDWRTEDNPDFDVVEVLHEDPEQLLEDAKEAHVKEAFNPIKGIGDAASWTWGAAKDSGNWAWDHPEVMGMAAGAALAPMTGGMSLGALGGGAMLGGLAGDVVGMGKGMLQGPAAPSGPAGNQMYRAPGSLSHTHMADLWGADENAAQAESLQDFQGHPSGINIEQDLSQLDPDGEAAELYKDAFPLIMHFATSPNESALDHPVLQQLDGLINQELGQKAGHRKEAAGLGGLAMKLGLPLVEKFAPGLAEKLGPAVERGVPGGYAVEGEGGAAALKGAPGAAPAANGSGWMKKGLGYGAMGLAATGMPEQMFGPSAGNMATGLMAGAYGAKRFGPMGGMMGLQLGQTIGQSNDPQPAPYTPPYLHDPSQLSHVQSDYEHPNSLPERGVDAESPEDVDPHEINDGDDNPIYDPNRGAGVGTYADPDYAKSESAADLMGDMMPLILHYYNTEQSGEQNPLMQMLDATLERDMPGYKSPRGNMPDSAVPAVTSAMPVPGVPQMNPGHVPQPDQQAGMSPAPGGQCPAGSTWNPSENRCVRLDEIQGPAIPQAGSQQVSTPLQASIEAAGQPVPQPDFSSPKCPHCGAQLPPGGAFMCPQCNQPTMGGPGPQQPQQVTPGMAGMPLVQLGKVAHQGPHTNEQYAAVAQLLSEQGRDDEITVMLQMPEQYADEMAQVQRKGFVPDDEAPQDPAPAQEEAPPQETMPVPPMQAPQQQMAAAVRRYATDEFTPRCPKCDSGSTGLEGEDGTCRCHACGNSWHREVEKDMVNKDSSRTSSWKIKIFGEHDVAEMHHHQDPNAEGVPAADREQPRDVEQEQDSSLSWVDSDGAPLKVGREYEMHSANYDIPDIVRINAVKPDSIEYELTGEYGLQHRTEITKEESDIEQLEFVPSDQEFQPEGDINPEQNTMDDYERNEPGQVDDLSVPAVKKTKRAYAEPDPSLENYPEDAPGNMWDEPAQNPDCPYCGGTGVPLGQLGAKSHFRCRDCGTDFSPESESLLGNDISAAPVNPMVTMQALNDDHEQFIPNGADPTYGKTSNPREQAAAMFEKMPDNQLKGVDISSAPPWKQQIHKAELAKREQGQKESSAGGPEAEYERHAAPRAWLLEGEDIDVPDTVPTEWDKTSGKNYSPMEQRDFIDEQGEARNQDKLNLAGTHYEEDDDESNDDLLFF